MNDTDLDEWVRASLAYLTKTCGQDMPWTDARPSSKETGTMNNGPQRVDPATCGCTDCLTGYSVPLNLATRQTMQAMFAGEVQDATSTELEAIVVVRVKDEPNGLSWSWEY